MTGRQRCPSKAPTLILMSTGKSALEKGFVSDEDFFVLRDGISVARLTTPGSTTRSAFFVRGYPIAAPRPRIGRFHVYHDDRADPWKSQIASAFMTLRQAPLRGPVELNLQFLFQRPKKDAVRFWKESKPDLDNLEKSVMDALTGARAWDDDAQVVLLQSLKRYALPDEFSGVYVEIAALPQSFEFRGVK